MSNCDKPDCLPCNPCITCDPCDPDYTDVGCCETAKTKCVIYDGDNIPCLNITKYENLNDILQHLKDVICVNGGNGYANFNFSCFSTVGITTEQQFVEFISATLCEVLGTQSPGSITSLSQLYSLIQSLTTSVNLIKNQAVISCFQTLSGLSSPSDISALLTAIQSVICNLDDRISALEGGSINTPITVNNIEKDVELSVSGLNNHTLTARVVRDPDVTNALTTSGVGLLCVSPDITVVDTQSINLTKSGTKGHTITADVKISSTGGNAASILSDGIYVNPAAITETPLVATDSTSIDFTQSGINGHTITADIIVNPSLSNILQSTPSGLLVTAASVQDPITPIDTATVDLTVSGGSGHTLRADVVVSPTVGNILSATGNGLYVSGAVLAPQAWNLLGNSGLTDGVNFLGNTDNVPLTFRVNNEVSGRISASGVTLFGYQAGLSNLSAGLTSFGYQAGKANSTGSNLVAIGSQALYNNTTGNDNTGVGRTAMYYLTTGSLNTSIGATSLSLLTTGSSNTALGEESGQTLTTGSYNTFLGVGTGTTLVTMNKSTVIGYGASASASNQFVIGGTSTNAVNVIVGGTAADASAIMDLTSTTKGFLPPRMTTTQKNAIAGPVAGLVVFDTTLTKLYCYDGAVWQAAW